MVIVGPKTRATIAPKDPAFPKRLRDDAGDEHCASMLSGWGEGADQESTGDQATNGGLGRRP